MLDPCDLVQGPVHRRGHGLVDWTGLVARHESRCVAVALEQVAQLLIWQPGEHCRIGDLVSVEVKDRQHGAIFVCVQELVRVPACGERSSLGLAVADHAEHDEARVVERRAV